MQASERGRLLNRLADLIEDHADELAALESLDNGKPVSVARAVDVAASVACYRYFRRLGGQGSRQDDSDRRRLTSATRGTSRWAWSDRSFPGTSRC